MEERSVGIGQPLGFLFGGGLAPCKGGDDLLLSQGDGIVGRRHVRARIIARLHPKVIYQSHPEILPLGRASAGDQRGEFLFQHIPAAVPRIFAGQAIPVVIAPRNRQAARIIDLVGERRENRHHHHCRDQDAHPFPLFSFAPLEPQPE